MKLEFDILRIDQFKSFIGAPHELVLSSFGPGLHLVRGRNLEQPRLEANGVGKSSLFDAICWCLTGRTCAGLRNPDVKARFGTRGPKVTLTFKLDDELNKLTRTGAPNKLTLNDREVGQDDVDALFGMNFDLITNTIILAQEQDLFFDLEPAKKLSLFGTALNQDRWTVRSDAADKRTTELEEQETTIVRALELLESKLAQTLQLLERALENWRTWSSEQEGLVERAQARVVDLTSQKDLKEQHRGGFDLAYDGAMTELNALTEEITALAQAGEELVFKRSGFHSQLGTFRAQILELEEELNVLGTTDTCPVCKQSIKGTDLVEHKRQAQQKFRELSGKRARLNSTVTTLTEQITANQRDLNKARADADEFRHKAHDAHDRRDQMTPTIERLGAEITQLRTGIKEHERTKNPYSEQIKQLRENKKELEANKKRKSEELPKLRTDLERVRFWVKGFKEVRLYELEDVLQELEISTAAALESVGLVEWKVQYVVERETKSGTIQRGLTVFIQGPQDAAPVRWECWSGGEKQRLRVVGALALSEVLLSRAGVEPNLEILDEPVSYLSNGGVDDLCDLLAERAQLLGRMCFYVDHASVESVRFSSVLTVIKDEEGSRLELEG